MEDSDCDLIAGKKGKKFAIEVKSSKKPVKYISKKQIDNFMVFSEIFALKPVIAVRFNRIGWYFLNPKDMEESDKNWVVNLEVIKKRGKRFAQFFDEKTKKDKILLEETEKNRNKEEYYDDIRDDRDEDIKDVDIKV